jgi:hypothetical protein
MVHSAHPVIYISLLPWQIHTVVLILAKVKDLIWFSSILVIGMIPNIVGMTAFKVIRLLCKILICRV